MSGKSERERERERERKERLFLSDQILHSQSNKPTVIFSPTSERNTLQAVCSSLPRKVSHNSSLSLSDSLVRSLQVTPWHSFPVSGQCTPFSESQVCSRRLAVSPSLFQRSVVFSLSLPNPTQWRAFLLSLSLSLYLSPSFSNLYHNKN